MSQTYTGNILCTLQAVDNVSDATVFNHMITNASNSSLNNVSFNTETLPANTAVELFFGAIQGVYIKNLNPPNEGLVGVSWDVNGVYADFGILLPGAFLLFFQPVTNTSGINIISNVQVNAITGGQIEWAVWV